MLTERNEIMNDRTPFLAATNTIISILTTVFGFAVRHHHEILSVTSAVVAILAGCGAIHYYIVAIRVRKTEERLCESKIMQLSEHTQKRKNNEQTPQ